MSVERDKVRLSVDITPEMNRRMDEMARALGGTKAEVFRKAIALLGVAIEAKQNNKKFGVAEKDQPLVTEIVGI